jgi:ABC-type multidrug transport system ATPase subunit
VVLYVSLPGAQSNPTIAPGEKFALPGPNGAGETPLISFSCGIVNPTENFPGAGHYQCADQVLSSEAHPTQNARVAPLPGKQA